MCRIAGIIEPGADINSIKLRVNEMCNLLEHGGPDDEGIFVDETGGLVLGNRRLALLDLSPAGHMPMSFGNRYTITYNGELYNYAELKAELVELGHRFQNHTDTEVILAAFAAWNSQSFSRFNGMFAFALFDKQENELYLVRDPAGIKPLYYSLEQGTLVFASEVRAFAAAGQHYTPHEKWPVLLLAYGHLPEPVTTFKEIKPIPKGCFLKYCLANAESQLQSFIHYSFSHRISAVGEAERLIANTLRVAVKQQMMSDAPMGVFLSGGLDSSILAALANENSKTALNTLSIFFDDPRFSEKKYQDLVIEKLQCKHAQFLLSENGFLKDFPAVLDDMDLPSCDGVNTWFISKFARQQGLKGVLSGIGGDELFGGYPSFNRMHLASLSQRLPALAQKLGRKSRRRSISRMNYLGLNGIKGLYLFLRGHFTPYEIARQLDMDEAQVWAYLKDTPLFMDVSELDNKNQASWMEFNLYMQNQLLRDADVMSMAHGVEIRVPMLDHRVIKAAFAIEPSAKYLGPLPKQLLINCFKDDLPSQIYSRPKMGFSFPFEDWLKKSEYVKDLLLSNQASNSAKAYNEFLKGKMKWYQLLSLVNLKKQGVAA